MHIISKSEQTLQMLDYLEAIESSARTYAADFQIVIKSGKNSKIIDSDGREYIDCLAGAGTRERKKRFCCKIIQRVWRWPFPEIFMQQSETGLR